MASRSGLKVAFVGFLSPASAFYPSLHGCFPRSLWGPNRVSLIKTDFNVSCTSPVASQFTLKVVKFFPSSVPLNQKAAFVGGHNLHPLAPLPQFYKHLFLLTTPSLLMSCFWPPLPRSFYSPLLPGGLFCTTPPASWRGCERGCKPGWIGVFS